MKLLSYLFHEREFAGVLSNGGETVFPFESFGIPAQSMNDFLRMNGQALLPKIESGLSRKAEGGIPFEQVELLAPIPEPAQDIICLGINFWAHAAESARYKKEAFERDRTGAVYFSKRVNRAVAQNGLIDGHFDLVDSLDYEAELALVLGKEAFRVPEADAFDYVLGYTILNDISARNVQTAHKQWYFGKSLDTFTPMGPWIVTADAFPRPPVLKIQSRVNGELRQDSSTDLFITGIAQVISELSAAMTLKAGTVISMGTPAGVGMGFTPPKFLKSGDTVECCVEGIGTLKNKIR